MSPSFFEALSRRCEGLSGRCGAEGSTVEEEEREGLAFSRSNVEFLEEGAPPTPPTLMPVVDAGRLGRGGFGDTDGFRE